jgi:hypothetical protein
MYSISAYCLAQCACSLCIFWIYPLSTTLLSFFFFGLQAHSFADMLLWAFILSLTALAGVLIGLFIGAFCDEKKSAVIVLQVCLIILNAGAGFLVNTGEGANFII